MFVKVSASIGAPTPRVLVEERAIGTDQRGDYLLVVNDKNVVEYRTVRLGIHTGHLRVIEDGVNAKDWVVVNGLQRARPGAAVTPEKTQMAAASNIAAEQTGQSTEGARSPVEDKANLPAKADATPSKSSAGGKAKAESSAQKPASDSSPNKNSSAK
jgi:hypothetical protein